MLTGRRAFLGEDVTDTLAAIVRGEPAWDALPVGTPAAVRRLLRRALEKDPARRLDSMRAARLELDDAGELPASVAAPAAARHRWTGVAALVAIASLALLGAAAVWSVTPAPPSTATRFSITPPPDTTLAFETNHGDLALLPNGRGLVYWNRIGTGNQMVLRTFDQFEPTPIPNFPDNGRGPFISADSQWVGFQTGSPNGADGALMKMRLTGGTPVRIAAIGSNLRGASWGATGTILFATTAGRSGLQRVSAAGGAVHVVTTPDRQNGELDHRWPHLLPGDTHAVFTIVRRDNSSDIALVDLSSGSWRVLVRDGTAPRYADGVLIYADDRGARWVRFDPRRLEIVGEPAPVGFPVVTKESGAANYDLAAGGTFAFRPGTGDSAALELAWLDPAGTLTPVPIDAKAYRGIRVSPDGRKAAVVVETGQDWSLWIADLERHTLSRVTPPGFSATAPSWRPDGRALVAAVTHVDEREHPPGLFLISPAGTTPPERLTQAPANGRHVTPSWNPDGTVVLFCEFSADASTLLRMRPGGTPERILSAPTRHLSPVLSPDGRWIAYVAFDSGRAEVYVRPYPDVDGDRIVVSSAGGNSPQWTRDGRELLYLDADRNLVAVPVIAGAKPSFGSAAVRMEVKGATQNFGVSPDGRRVLTTARPARQSSSPNEYRVVLGLIDELKRSAR
jgi:serine/threonine-protein kinase